MSSGPGFCHKCGAQLPPGAAFCARCGTAVGSAGAPTAAQPAQPASPQQVYRGEKSEKHEKHEKNEKGEKGAGGGMLGALVGGLILIWLGVSFFMEQNGYLPTDTWWAYFIAGIGAILILQGAVIYSRGRTGIGPLIGGAILLFVGFSAIASTQFNIATRFWPLIIVALGVFVLFAGIASRRRVPAP